MHTLTHDDLTRHPQMLIDHAQRGQPAIVTIAGQPVMMMVPLAKGVGCSSIRLELAAGLYDHEQISLGMAARIAGLSYSQMIDELGRRGIATIRHDPEDWDRELAYLRSLGGS